MSRLWCCCCGVPGGFVLASISVSASVYLVKQNDMKAATSEDHRDGEFKEEDVLTSKMKVYQHICTVYHNQFKHLFLSTKHPHINRQIFTKACYECPPSFFFLSLTNP